MPAIEPSATEWSPPSTSGNAPSEAASSTARASASHAVRIGPRYFAFGLPGCAYSCEGTATGDSNFSVRWPSPSSRLRRPARRIAEGPMSEPWRLAP